MSLTPSFPVSLRSLLPRSLPSDRRKNSDRPRRACFAILQLVPTATCPSTVRKRGICVSHVEIVISQLFLFKCLRRRCGERERHDATSPSQPGSSVRGDDDDGILPPNHQPTAAESAERRLPVLIQPALKLSPTQFSHPSAVSLMLIIISFSSRLLSLITNYYLFVYIHPRFFSNVFPPASSNKLFNFCCVSVSV